MDIKELMKEAYEEGQSDNYIEGLPEGFDKWYAEEGETLANEYKASRLKPMTDKMNEGLELIREEMENFAK